MTSVINGKFSVVQGDLFSYKPSFDCGERIIVPHIVNNVTTGSGFIAALVKKYPNVGRNYQRYIDKLNNSYWGKSCPDSILGKVYFCKAGISTGIYIANMIAQDNAGTSGVDSVYPPVRYAALSRAMEKVRQKWYSLEWKNKNLYKTNAKVHIIAPRFGSGIAGGNQDVIEQLMHEHWVSKGIDVSVYELPPVFKEPPIPDIDEDFQIERENLMDFGGQRFQSSPVFRVGNTILENRMR